MQPEDYKRVQHYIENLAAQLPLEADLRARPMFGGVCMYTKDRAFLTLSSHGVALKLPKDEHAKVIEQGRGEAGYNLEAPGGGQYVVLPSALVDDEGAFRVWLEKSIRHTQSLPLKKRKSG